MALSYRLVKDKVEQQRAWDEVVGACGYATFFHTRAWAELFASTLGTWETDPSVLEFSDGNRVVLPMMRRLDSEHRESVVPGMYGGPLFAQPPTEAHWDLFNDVPIWYPDIFIVDNPFAPCRWDPNGLVKWRDHTHIADLSGGFDQTWKRFRTNIKRNIRKAQEAGIEIRAGSGSADARTYVEIYEDTVSRWADRLMSYYPLALFENLMALPEYGRNIRLSLAYVDGLAVSGLLMFYWGDVAIAWHYSTRSDHLDSHACPLLLTAAMEQACADGFRWFDFLCSGPLTGVAHFKEGFGSTKTPYNMFWSPGLTPDDARSDTGPGAALDKIRQLQQRQGGGPS